jgi:cobyrinic acid a,c-diamide synthase
VKRLVIAGLAGESGKTLVSLAALAEARARGREVRAFKKGPDYIDAAWLSLAAGVPARNLDTWLMGFDGAAALFRRHASGWNLVEGNRGLYDGVDARGSHSTAALARALDAPVVLVVNAAKMTGTAAAVVLGCQKLDPAVRLAGVILNRVAGARHERVLREAIETVCGIPVLGAVPRMDDPLPERHLGLVTPAEQPGAEDLIERVRASVAPYLNFEAIENLMHRRDAETPRKPIKETRRLGVSAVIGYVADTAFTFYYPDNLEALREAGAELVAVSALRDSALPRVDALYIGGGFPETHGRALAANRSLLAALAAAAAAGMPVYAECGGLMLLARAILWRGERYPMAGALPFDIEVCETPQGHGYAELRVDAANPFFALGTRLRGHEFHYSRIAGGEYATGCAVERGTGTGGGRDAVLVNRVWAAYTHLHAAATPEWARGLVAAALNQESNHEVFSCPSP